MSALRAIAFDWGGVFTEGTFDSSAVVALAALYGVERERVAEAYFPLMARFECGEFGLDAFQRALEVATGLEAWGPAFRSAFLGAVRPRDAMVALLGSLPRAYRVGMLSNNVPILCDRVRSDPRMQRIERFVFSNEIGVRKPDAAAFAALTAALGESAEATVFVDDNEANVEAANALGYRGLLIDDVPGFARRWRAALPDLPLPPGLA